MIGEYLSGWRQEQNPNFLVRGREFIYSEKWMVKNKQFQSRDSVRGYSWLPCSLGVGPLHHSLNLGRLRRELFLFHNETNKCGTHISHLLQTEGSPVATEEQDKRDSHDRTWSWETSESCQGKQKQSDSWSPSKCRSPEPGKLLGRLSHQKALLGIQCGRVEYWRQFSIHHLSGFWPDGKRCKGHVWWKWCPLQ